MEHTICLDPKDSFGILQNAGVYLNNLWNGITIDVHPFTQIEEDGILLSKASSTAEVKNNFFVAKIRENIEFIPNNFKKCYKIKNS